MDPFDTSLQHLLAELERLDLLVRVQVWRARQLHAGDNEFSPYYIAEGEVDALLEQAVGRPLWADMPLPDGKAQEVAAILAQQADAIAARTAVAESHGIDLRLPRLSRLFDLTPLEQDILLISLAPEIDLRYTRLYAYLQDDLNQRLPTVELALNLLCGDVTSRTLALNTLAPTAPLRRFALVELAGNPSYATPAPLLAQTLRLSDRVRRFLFDDDTAAHSLQPFLAPPMHADSPAFVPPAVAQMAQWVAGSPRFCFYLHGPDDAGKRSAAFLLAEQLQRPCLALQTRQLLDSDVTTLPVVLARIEREARLQDAVVFWPDFDALLDDTQAGRREPVLDLLAGSEALWALGGRGGWDAGAALGAMPFARVALPLPTTAERRAIWAARLNGQTAGLDLDLIASQFSLSATQIQHAAVTAQLLAQRRDGSNGRVQTRDLLAASRLHSNRRLASLAQPVTPRYGWRDIVLPDAEMAQLRQMCDQMKYRARVLDDWEFDRKLALGKGLNALFTGPPGTGKTMAADILAGELGLDLYKIDLSAVVSKYIGETEKNLSRIFAEGETSNAILFFDEADALFGKRTEVKDAHDRYANLETSYLLQKMDEYPGMVILATNLRHNMDRAFVRRMQFIVEFPLPTVAERRRIWEQIWPEAAPVSPDIDFDHLAEQIDVAGGHIRNIALAAAFSAAAADSPITTAHILGAAEKEYRKIGKWLSGSGLAAAQRA